MKVRSGLSTNEAKCAIDSKSSRFACSVGFIFLIAGLFFFQFQQSSAAWVLVLIAGTVSIVAGTTGFCLGAAMYSMLFKKHQQITEKE
jgi:hypothetical protein